MSHEVLTTLFFFSTHVRSVTILLMLGLAAFPLSKNKIKNKINKNVGAGVYHNLMTKRGENDFVAGKQKL